MARMNSYSLLFVSLSKLITALPLLASTTATVAPDNVANGTIIAGCTAFHTVIHGDTCISVEADSGISDALFRMLNPEINAGCTNLITGEAYCVQSSNSTNSTGTGTGTGSVVAQGTIVEGCTGFFTVGANDSCATIEAASNISDTLFKIMNPELNSDCSNLLEGLEYCVQTSNLTNIPSNVSPGTITAGCVRYFTVPTGDSCPDIESEFNITNSLFHALNPQVNSECSNLGAGEAYCVVSINTTTIPSNVAAGTITSGCTEFHTVAANDSCATIEAQFDISFTILQTLNPEINDECTNLLLGEAYCVQTSDTNPAGPPDNVAQGTITQGCTEFFTVQPGDSCPTIQDMFNITGSFLRVLNPEINSVCSNLIAGDAYCVQTSNSTVPVGPPSNVASGTITDGCTTFFTVEAGDSCTSIEGQFNITLATLISLNPELNSQCTNLLVGEAYCVQSSS